MTTSTAASLLIWSGLLVAVEAHLPEPDTLPGKPAFTEEELAGMQLDKLAHGGGIRQLRVAIEATQRAAVDPALTSCLQSAERRWQADVMAIPVAYADPDLIDCLLSGGHSLS